MAVIYFSYEACKDQGPPYVVPDVSSDIHRLPQNGLRSKVMTFGTHKPEVTFSMYDVMTIWVKKKRGTSRNKFVTNVLQVDDAMF